VVLLVLLAAVGVTYSTLWRSVPGFAHWTEVSVRELLGLAPKVGRGPEIIRRDGRRFISGSPDHAFDESEMFDVTEFRLDPGEMRHGLGREHFAALLEPRFIPAAEAEGRWLADDTRVLVLRVGDDLRVYPVPVLRAHEVVNDVVGGRPVFAAYCVLANLGAIYDRRVGGETLTFAVSGYTYADPEVWDGRHAFVLWDRDTESLWWPPVGRAVSGPLIDAPLDVLDEALWSQTTWAQVRDACRDAPVLANRQDHAPPRSWPRLRPAPRGATTQPRLAPRWGANPDLGERAGS
jgi:hypothetical protein